MSRSSPDSSVLNGDTEPAGARFAGRGLRHTGLAPVGRARMRRYSRVMTPGPRPRDHRAALVTLSVLLIIAAAVLAGARMVSVHSETWEGRLAPSAAPPRIAFDHRYYVRSDAPASPRPAFTPAGQTSGGGEVFAPAPIPGLARTVIQVVADGRVTDYALSGGP